MKPVSVPLAWPALLLASLAACGDPAPESSDPTAAAGDDGTATVQQNPAGFAVWHADFPFPVHLSPANRAERYSFSRRQALEHVVDHLSGACSPEGWKMAREFFGRAPEEAIPLLIEAMDRAMQSPHAQDIVQNTVEAMGRMGRFRSEELAAALLRALEHPKVSVQNSAMGALAQAGTPDSVRRARRWLDGLQMRAWSDWLRAVRVHLPDDREAIFSELLNGEDARIFPFVAEQTLLLEPAAAVRVLGPLWDQVRGPLRLSIAVVLHATGDSRGTSVLHDALRATDAEAKVTALAALRSDDLERFGDEVLKLSVDEDPGVRAAVARLVATMPGENANNVLALLALDAAPAVREQALRALSRRGGDREIARLLDAVRTGTGSVLINALSDLSAAGIPEAVSVIYERMEASPPGERRKFIQAIGRSGLDEAFGPLKQIFLQPEVPLGNGAETTLTYAAVLLPNLRGCTDRTLGLLHELPREDYRRRAWLVHRAGVAAVDGEDTAFAARVYDTYRTIVADREEIPQMRLLALEYLRRDLSLDDMERIKKMQETETGPMRRALVDFLFEFF